MEPQIPDTKLIHGRFSIDHMLDIVGWLGIALEPVAPEERSDLYAWVTPEGGIVYIGKSESAARVRNEERWIESGRELLATKQMVTAFQATMIRNRAECQRFRFHAGTSSLEHAANLLTEYEWQGPAVDAFNNNHTPLTVREVEYLMIRICVNAGAALSNASGTGMWESCLLTRGDLLAQFALAEMPGFRDSWES